MPLRTQAAIPIFRIFDVAKARAFHLDFLGFQLGWEHRFDDAAPPYMEVSLGALKLHLSEHHGDACPGSTAFDPVAGLDDHHREIMAKGYGHLRPGVEPTGHGSRGMEVVDPFGNRIRFDESATTPAGAGP